MTRYYSYEVRKKRIEKKAKKLELLAKDEMNKYFRNKNYTVGKVDAYIGLSFPTVIVSYIIIETADHEYESDNLMVQLDTHKIIYKISQSLDLSVSIKEPRFTTL